MNLVNSGAAFEDASLSGLTARIGKAAYGRRHLLGKPGLKTGVHCGADRRDTRADEGQR
jgi:hypothetical protein